MEVEEEPKLNEVPTPEKEEEEHEPRALEGRKPVAKV